VYTTADLNKLDAIDAALGCRDRYTQAHARRVSIYAMRLARRIGLPAHEVEHIGIGGILHDTGKIGLSRRILNNTTRHLCQAMLQEVRQHPEMGVALLKNIDFLQPVLDYIHYHHERVDGNGYPCGLKAEQIPLGAKIISIADCFDAITTDRPYQKRKNSREALTILGRMAGTSLCPDLVAHFIAEIETNGMIEE
jgi:HD-GYP domain-containing protein (c-di-GMP phosphodiesterase class II)